MAKRQYYGIEDLYNFCKNNKFEKFNSKTMGAPIVVQTLGSFEANESTYGDLMPVKLKACHTGKNLNQSYISDDAMKAAMSSFKGKPILGAIYLTDTGEYEFRGHDTIVDDEGNVEFIEQPIGVVSQIEEPYLEYDEDADKNYLMVSGTIFTEYSHAAEILQRRKTCSCSVELAIDDFSYSIDDDCLSIDAFTFLGVAALGTEQDGVTPVNPGMAGSNITIADFSKKNNSMFTIDNQDKLIEVLDKLNTTLSNFSGYSEKGGCEPMGKFEELLEKYGKTVDDIEFEHEDLTDEELEAKFIEAFGEIEDNDDEEDPDGDEPEIIDTEACKKKKKCELNYDISHDQVRSGLYELLNVESKYYTWIVDVYDSYFIYEDYEDSAKFYRQKYTRDEEALKFDGERTEIFSEWLTAEEKDALAALKADYATLKEFKENYDAEALNAEKNAVFESPEYADIKETEEFKAIVENAVNYSVDEIKIKCDLLFAKHVKSTGQFAASHEEKPKAHSVGINLKPSATRTKPYGRLFSE